MSTKKQRSAELAIYFGIALKKYGIENMGAYFLSIMVGEDPRPGKGQLYTLVNDVKDPMPTKEEWEAIKTKVLLDPMYRGENISLDTSLKAAEKIVNYIYPKLNTIDANVTSTDNTPKTLNAEELKEFIQVYKKVVNSDNDSEEE